MVPLVSNPLIMGLLESCFFLLQIYKTFLTVSFGKIEPFPMQSFSLDLSLFTDASCLEISLTCFSPDDIIALGITYMSYLKPRMTVSDTPLLPNPKRSPAKTP